MFKPPTICKLVGSSKYAPLTNLPSQNLPPVILLPNCTYKPSWMQHHIVEKPIQHSNNIPSQTLNTLPSNNPVSVGSNSSIHHQSNAGTPASMFPSSPLHGPGFRPPPPPYEMASPATSTASSYLNKNLNSVEPVSTPIIQR